MALIRHTAFRLFILVALGLVIIAAPRSVTAEELPDGFVYLHKAVPGAVLEVRYHSGHNFVGERIDGYESPLVILTGQAAKPLAEIQAVLSPFGLGLKFFDGYRPQRAVDHFVRWAEDVNDTRMKAEFYPGVEKRNLFRDGYIAAKSSHSRGSTVDLTIIDLKTGKELDMGTNFDFFGPKSWPDNPDMSQQARANRALLRNLMTSYGFRPLKEEWWHFTLENEPYPETYFDFVVK